MNNETVSAGAAVREIVMETGLGKGSAEYGNMGDISMLQVAVERLSRLFPNASVHVLTDSPESLHRYCPSARPLENRGRILWLSDGVGLGALSATNLRWIVDLLVKFKRAVRLRYPRLFREILTGVLRCRKQHRDIDAIRNFSRVWEQSNLVLVCGAGGFYDGCPWWSLPVLQLIEEAIQNNVAVALLGQGFGPLNDVGVLNRAAKILPKVSFITLRGNRGALPALQSLGVPRSKLEVTGDEALEIAYEARSDELGHGVGINLRFGGSASTDDNDLVRVKSALGAFAKQRSAHLIPLPIAMQKYNRDDVAIKLILSGLDELSDGGATLDSPRDVIDQVRHCRIVVTGAYHAAVFALAQGVPVIGLAKSDYYASKFWGLEDQFGEGCQTVLLDRQDFTQRFRDAVENAWQNAERLRPLLLSAGLRQIEASRRSYEKLKNLVA